MPRQAAELARRVKFATRQSRARPGTSFLPQAPGDKPKPHSAPKFITSDKSRRNNDPFARHRLLSTSQNSYEEKILQSPVVKKLSLASTAIFSGASISKLIREMAAFFSHESGHCCSGYGAEYGSVSECPWTLTPATLPGRGSSRLAPCRARRSEGALLPPHLPGLCSPDLGPCPPHCALSSFADSPAPQHMPPRASARCAGCSRLSGSKTRPATVARGT